MYTVSQKMDRQYFGRNFDKFRKLLTIFVTNHPDNPCDWKIVKCPINTFTTLRNGDVIVTSLKCRFRKKRNARIHSAFTVASKLAGFKSSWLKGVRNTARQGVQNMHDWSRQPQALHKNLSGLSSITPSLQLLFISDVVSVRVRQGRRRSFRALFLI